MSQSAEWEGSAPTCLVTWLYVGERSREKRTRKLLSSLDDGTLQTVWWWWFNCHDDKTFCFWWGFIKYFLFEIFKRQSVRYRIHIHVLLKLILKCIQILKCPQTFLQNIQDKRNDTNISCRTLQQHFTLRPCKLVKWPSEESFYLRSWSANIPFIL